MEVDLSEFTQGSRYIRDYYKTFGSYILGDQNCVVIHPLCDIMRVAIYVATFLTLEGSNHDFCRHSFNSSFLLILLRLGANTRHQRHGLPGMSIAKNQATHLMALK